jgi:hypothetical protein
MFTEFHAISIEETTIWYLSSHQTKNSLVNDFDLIQFKPHQLVILVSFFVLKFFEYRITVFNPEPHLSFTTNLYSAL